MAKYRFEQRSYHGDRLIEKGQEFEIGDDVIPGPHMFPLDDAAKAAAEKGNVVFTGEVPDVLGKLLPLYTDALKNHGNDERLTPANLATAFAAAVKEVLGGKAVGGDEAAIEAEVQKRVADEIARIKQAAKDKAEAKAKAEADKAAEQKK